MVQGKCQPSNGSVDSTSALRKPFVKTSAADGLALFIVAALVREDVLKWDTAMPFSAEHLNVAVRVVAACLKPLADDLQKNHSPLPFDW